MNSRPTSATTAVSFGSKCSQKLKDISIVPKVTMYRTDGTGRDTYINYDNGGFKNITSSNYRKVYAIKNESGKATNIIPKFAIYKSDGYGRDSYIYTDCGGLYQVVNKHTFPSLLRSYGGFQTYKRNDYLHYVKAFRPKKVLIEKKELCQKQRLLSAKLAQPKF